MDTIKILLGATIALLLGALALSWMNTREAVRSPAADELARLKGQIEDLRREQDRRDLQELRQLQQLRSSQPAVAPAPVLAAPQPDTAELEALKAEIAARDAALKELETKNAKAERDANTFRDEAGLVLQKDLEKSDSELRRARMISEALVMGRVTGFEEDPQYGSFVTLEVLMPENVRSGDMLAIRRKTGILGQLKVSDVTPEGAIANLMSGFGPVKPEVGDELILPPQY